MPSLLILVGVAAIFNGTLAGLSLDTALVKLPARRRIGARAYAVFARGNDLGNGLRVYPAWAIISALLVFASTALALAGRSTPPGRLLLVVASVMSVIHFAATSRAAPAMLSIKNAPDDESVLSATLDIFARWHAVRATFQLLTFVVLVVALKIS